MTEKNKGGRPRDPGLAVIAPDSISDWQARPFFELVVMLHLPSVNEFMKLNRRDLFRLHKEAHTALYDAFKRLNLNLTADHRRYGTGKATKWQLTWRLDKDMVFPGRAILHSSIYRTGHSEADSRNFLTPMDKLIIDKLTEPKPSKWRGFGLLVDDSDRFLYTFLPEVHYGAPQHAVVLHFHSLYLPKGLAG